MHSGNQLQPHVCGPILSLEPLLRPECMGKLAQLGVLIDRISPSRTMPPKNGKSRCEPTALPCRALYQIILSHVTHAPLETIIEDSISLIQTFNVQPFLWTSKFRNSEVADMSAKAQSLNNFTSMVLLMGSTGSGKSHFINKLKKGATVESDSLYSCEFWNNMFPLLLQI